MSKRNSILIISAIAIIVIGGLLFFYFSSDDKTATQITTSTTNPFGGIPGDREVGQGPETGIVSDTTSQTVGVDRLTKLYRNPTSGSVFFVNKNNQNVLRFVDRAVGNIYEYILDIEGGGVQRVTNITIPKIQEVVWSNTGNDLILRYLEGDTDNISSFSAKLKSGTGSTDSLAELTGIFLSQNIKQLVINPLGDKVFGIFDKSDKSGTYGFIGNLTASDKKTIFESPISYFNISWPKENIISFTTKPNYKDEGLLYFFNTRDYSFDRVLGGIVGLSAVINKDADLVAYSYSVTGGFYLDIYDTVNKIGSGLRIPTLADKCVWGNKNAKVLYCSIPKTIPGDNYPDAWYQGLQSFSDDIWKINFETGEMYELYNISLNEGDIDAFDLKISRDDKYLSFSNKNDLSLWLLRLGQ